MLRLIRQRGTLHASLKKKIIERWDDMAADNAKWMDGLNVAEFESMSPAVRR